MRGRGDSEALVLFVVFFLLVILSSLQFQPTCFRRGSAVSRAVRLALPLSLNGDLREAEPRAY